jgi:hypothetical protein
MPSSWATAALSARPGLAVSLSRIPASRAITNPAPLGSWINVMRNGTSQTSLCKIKTCRSKTLRSIRPTNAGYSTIHSGQASSPVNESPKKNSNVRPSVLWTSPHFHPAKTAGQAEQKWGGGLVLRLKGVVCRLLFPLRRHPEVDIMEVGERYEP